MAEAYVRFALNQYLALTMDVQYMKDKPMTEREHLPRGPAEDSRWVNLMALLEPLELRFHCPFTKVDMGHEDSGEGERLKTKSVVESFLKKNNLLALSQNP